jgi:hypothetical protein
MLGNATDRSHGHARLIPVDLIEGIFRVSTHGYEGPFPVPPGAILDFVYGQNEMLASGTFGGKAGSIRQKSGLGPIVQS